jgi:hypothetical protein
MFIEFFESRRNVRFNRPLPEDLGAELMNRCDSGFFQTLLCVLEVVDFIFSRSFRPSTVELEAESKAEFTGRLAGKGDGNDVVDFGTSGPKYGRNATHQF